MEQRSFTEILDECIDRVLLRGESIDACVADHPAHAAALREALGLATGVRGAMAYQPDADRKRDARLGMRQVLDRKVRPSVWRRFNPVRAVPAPVHRLAAVAAVLAITLIGGGTGTVLAATGAVPGDPLYVVKRATERTQLALAFTDAREASLREQFLGRRVDELEHVTEAGRQQFVPELAEQIERHVARASALAAGPVDDALLDRAGNVPGTDAPPADAETVTVPVKQLLEINARLAALQSQIDQLLAQAGNDNVRQALGNVKNTLEANRATVSHVLDRAQDVAVLAPPSDVREIDAAVLGTDAHPAPTPTPGRADPTSTPGRVDPTPTPEPDRPTPTATPTPRPVQAPAQLRSVDAVLEEVELELRDRVGFLKLKVRTSDGERHEVKVSTDRTRILRGNQPARLHDLVSGVHVRAFFDARGDIRAIQILSVLSDRPPDAPTPTPSRPTPTPRPVDRPTPTPASEPTTRDLQRIPAEVLTVAFARADGRVVAQAELRLANGEVHRVRWVEGQVRVVEGDRQVPLRRLAPHQRLVLIVDRTAQRIVQVVIVAEGEPGSAGDDVNGLRRGSSAVQEQIDGLRQDVEETRRRAAADR